jgi:Aerotolerance regulator N-terminal
MIALLTPLGLAALAALALPLAIHWIRRSDRQLIPFAAMRYLREQPHSREKSRLHERRLLLLRMLLIASLALGLSLPVWRGRSEPQSPWILVAPGIDAEAARSNIAAPAAEWHWLAPGAPLTSLVREVDSELAPATALTIIVPADLGGLDSERLQLRRPITWRVLPGAGPKSTVAVRPLLAARYDPADLTELPLVRALAAAWQADGAILEVDIATADKPLPALPAWLIWLGAPVPGSVNQWVRRGGSLLLSRQPAAAGPIVLAEGNGSPVLREQVLGAGRVLSLAGPLRAGDVPALAAADFPKTLAALLRSPTSAPDRAPAASVAPLQLPAPQRPLGRPQSLAPYLALLIAALFLFERVYATRARTRNPDRAGASVGART